MDMLKFYLSTTFQKRRRSKLTGIPVDAGHSRSGGPKLFPIAVTLLNCMWECGVLLVWIITLIGETV